MSDTWLTVLFVLAMVLELVGIAWVVIDIRGDVSRARRLGEQQAQTQESAMSVKGPYLELVAALTSAGEGFAWKRLIGPALIALGVIIGAVANIAALGS